MRMNGAGLKKVRSLPMKQLDRSIFARMCDKESQGEIKSMTVLTGYLRAQSQWSGP